MEGSPIKPNIKTESTKIEQSVGQISFSQQEKNIQEVFKLSPELKIIACEAFGFNPDYNGIKIELGRNKKVSYGTVQNINLRYNDESVIDETSEDWVKDRAKIVAVDMGNEVVVGNIVFPESIKGKGLAKYTYQAIADKLRKPVVDSLKYQKEIGAGYGQSEAGSMVWKNRESFNPYELKPEQEQKVLQLYQEYLKTVFPDSKLQEVVYHGTNRKFDKFEKKHGLDDLSGINGVDDYYFTDNIKLAKFFAEKYKKALYAIHKSYESGNIDWYFKRQENSGDFSEFKNSTKELWDNIYKEWEYIVTEANNGKELNEILKEPDIKYFENKEGFGFRFGKMLLPYYLMSDYDYYKTYPDGNIIPAVLDLKKPYIKQGDRNSMDGILSEAGYKHKKEDSEIDGGIQQDTEEKNIVVFRPEQIHVLGSESDVENFKEFVSKNESKHIKQSIHEFLKESGFNNIPKIETQFFFNQHSTIEDGKMVADRLIDKDIFIQENAGWDKERLETWRKVSSGEFTAEQAIEHEKERGKPLFWPDYFKTIFEKLHGSNKDVLLVDVKSDSEVYQELISFFGKESPYWNLVDKSKSYEETCEYISNISEFESILQTERENEILENLKINLLDLLKQKPELKDKENLKILFSMGSFHTRLYHEMKKSGDNVSREFQSNPYTFSPRMAVERVVHFKGNEKAKEYMPKILLLWLLERSNMKYEDISKKVLSKFSDEQTRELFEMYKKSESDDRFRVEAQTWVIEQFKNKN